MQIRVDKLRKTMVLLQPVVSKSPTLKILTNVLFKDGNMRATDLETEVSVGIPEMNGEAFLLPFKQALEVLKYVPGDLLLTIESKGKSVRLSWDGGSASYMVVDYADYPDTALRTPASEAFLNGEVLIGAMAGALPYCATETTRPVLSGVSVNLDTAIQVFGADGFRVSFEALKLSFPIKQTIVVPPNTVKVLESLWHKEPGKPNIGNSLVEQLTAARPLTLGLWEGFMSVKFANITLVCKLIAGTPPDILALLNNFKEPVKVKVFAPDLFNAVRRLAGVAKEGSNIVMLQWTDRKMTISACNGEIGEITTEIPIQEGSNPGRIALNLNYLLDYLTGKEGLVTLGGETDNSPAVVHYGNRPIVAIMPMAAKWGDEPREDPKLDEDKTESVEGEANDTEEETEQIQNETQSVEEETPEVEHEKEPVSVSPEPKKKGGRRKKEKTK